MDGIHFDRLARAIGIGATRRATLGLGAAGLLGALGPDDANAKKNKKKCKKKCGPCRKCKKGKCKPKQAGASCGNGKQCFGNGECRACDVCANGCPRSSLAEAIEVASDGETIHVCTGTYPMNAVITKDVTVIGAGSGTNGTILDGEEAGRVVNLDGATVILRTLRVAGGRADDNGGGIYVTSGTLTLDACVVSDNEADINGGGFYVEAGTLILTDCDISSNKAGSNGAGIYSSGTLNITDSSVSENEAGSHGGGIYNFADGAVTLSGSDVSENTADTGGGIYNNGDTLTLIDSKMTGNDAAGRGGGIFNRNTTPTLDARSRITGNTAGDTGGGIYINDASGTVALASAANVSGNDPNNCAGVAAVPLCAGYPGFAASRAQRGWRQ